MTIFISRGKTEYLIRPAWHSCVINFSLKKKKRSLVNLSQNSAMLIAYSLNQHFIILQTNNTCLLWSYLLSSRNACAHKTCQATEVCAAMFFCCWTVDTYLGELNRPSSACLLPWLTHRTCFCRRPQATLPCPFCYRTTRSMCPKQKLTWKPKLNSWSSCALLYFMQFAGL